VKRFKLSLKELVLLFLITFVPVFLIYLPFYLKLDYLFFLKIKPGGFLNIIRNWDGPNYLVIAKTWYDPEKIKLLIFAKSADYYPAHFPLFPIFIYLFHFLFGWLKAGIAANLLIGFLLNILFYYIARQYTKKAVFLTLVFTIFPGRFLITRAIIAPEPLMVLFTLASLYLFEKKKYWTSSFFGFLAVLTKIQPLFLFFAYGAVFIEEMIKNKKIRIRLNHLSILAIPLAILTVFGFYYLKLSNFWAFFGGQKNSHLSPSWPFSQFNYLAVWGGFRLEDVTFYIVAMVILISALWKTKERSWLYFALFYTIFLVLLPQRDITRFSYLLLPLFLITFRKFFTSELFKYGFLFSLPAIYFYVVNFILVNQAPIADWSRFLK